MNILHAMTDPDLLTRFREMLGSSARADIAVGYFFMSGFDAVADDLAQLDKVRILVGRTDRRVLEEVALALQQADALRARMDADSMVRRGQRAEIAQRAVANVSDGVAALPQTADSERAVTRLRDMITVNRVEVRAYLRSPLHAKAYLCWYEGHAEPGSAIVGSSNFTLAGFEGNTELNVRVTGDAEMHELGRWFDGLWDDSEDISEALMSELNRSWPLAQTPPYHVYLKALRELYGSEIGRSELILAPRSVELTNFQTDAVSRGLAMIETHGGCYIGDVVGLGKTYIGAELLRQLRVSYPQDGPPLILCPAGLRPMWQRVSEEFGLGAEVLSHSVIAPPPNTEFDEETGRYVDADRSGRGVVLQSHYQNRGPVLVDEAHNFRNVNGRSIGLRSYLEAGNHRVVLLSATPQNLGPRDIYRQLRLFLDETEHGLNIEPLGLEDYFRNAIRWHEYRAEDENYKTESREWVDGGRKGAPPIPPDKPSVPRADIEQVLTPVFIRRRRRDIKELYADAAIEGEPVSFPEPKLDNAEYRLDKVYSKAGSFEELETLLGRHRAARYRVTDYIKPEAARKPDYQDLFRAKNRIARLMRALLFKRLESSVAAFRSTLNSLIRSNRNFRDALEKGYVPVGSTATRLLAGESFDAEDALEVLRAEEENIRESGATSKLFHSTEDFLMTNWLEDLDADYETLNEILNRIRDIGPMDDDKLRVLREFLDRPDVKSGKVLIFSEAETTIEYLHEQLNPGGKKPKIARLAGSTRDRATDIVRRFAPGSNPGPKEVSPDREIRTLLATDIISEGQNLQDCARILNYDLHWNPVRLIQRFGRIDRIGSEHETIHLHNMWPDTAVDAELDLTDRLHNRIQSFHDLIGLDSKLLSESERLNEKEMYGIYSGQMPEAEDGLDEVAANQRAIALLQRIQDDDPDLWTTIESLPDGIRSALAAKTSGAVYGIEGSQVPLEIDGAQMPLMSPSNLRSGPSPFDEPGPGETLVLLGTGDVKGCYAVSVDEEGNPLPRPISPAQFISAAECAPDTPAQPLPQDTNERVMEAFRAFQSDLSRRLGRARRRRPDSRNRRYISRQLNIVRAQVEPSEAATVETLRRIFLGDLSPQAENALSEIRSMRIEGTALMRRLGALRERYRLNPRDDADDVQEAEPQVIRVICSDGLTGQAD